MTYVIRYSPLIDWKRFSKLPHTDKLRMKNAIEKKLAMRPDIFGKPLRQSLTGARSLRVGDYRIVYRISGTVVDILLFGHRSTVYGDTEGIL
jgi:mRNA interferase RelE/StbE